MRVHRVTCGSGSSLCVWPDSSGLFRKTLQRWGFWISRGTHLRLSHDSSGWAACQLVERHEGLDGHDADSGIGMTGREGPSP